jgi:3-(3-hydroxy-phenyl)propionate hydroxylase
MVINEGAGEEATTCDVLIVGLGPTGAVLANLLGQQGFRVVGLEREVDLYYAPRAVHFDDEVMRIFQYAGLSAAISRTSEPFTEMEFALRWGARAALRARVGSQDARYGHAGAWWFHQPTLEAHLHAGMERFPGVTRHLGVDVREIEQDGESVLVTARDREGGRLVFRARYVIGCDGGRSFVRRAVDLPLETADFDEAWVVVDTKTRTGEKHPDLPGVHRQICDPAQPITYVPLAGPYYEWQFMVTGGKSEREATDPVLVREQLRGVVDLDTIEITRIAFYKFHALWAREWRRGRVILAGDAAHQMPPFLGQGMCSGVRDAHSLGWRLALVLAGKAGVQLLDSYQAERSAHVQHIIKGAMLLGRIIQTRNPLVALLRNTFLFRPASRSASLNRLFYETANRKRPLETGLIGPHHRALAGTLSPQPEVSRGGGSSVLLDEALGLDFALLVRRGRSPLDACHAALARLRACVGARLVEFAATASGDVLGDTSGRLAAWVDTHGVDFVILRPDRYVFDAGRAGALDAVSRDFCQRFLTAAGPSPRAQEAA